MSLDLHSSISILGPIAVRLKSKLKKINIETIGDLIFCLPFRHDDYSQVVDISALQSGLTATIRGRLELLRSRRGWRRGLFVTEGIVSDQTGSVRVVWYNQPYISKVLPLGSEIFVAGRVDAQSGGLFFNSPSYEKVTEQNKTGQTVHTGRLVPVYHLTKGLSAKQFRYLVKEALNSLPPLADFLPADILKKYTLLDHNSAIRQIHFPPQATNLKKAQDRWRFDQLLLLQLQNQIIRRQLAATAAQAFNFNQKVVSDFVKHLPFKLTPPQKKSAWEILQDLQKSSPMNRLLEGDVGSGKTVVAAIAAVNVAAGDGQTAFLAPTEILASQHAKTLQKLLASQKMSVALLTRTTSQLNGRGLDKSELLSKIARGAVEVVVGTHSLLQEKVNFKNLGLVVVDEQHRFGVKQRAALQKKSGDPSTCPHLLSMTATPIPRTLALTFYGDLDLSIIDQLPPGRQPIVTKLVPQDKRYAAYDFIKKQIQSGRQIFVICPLIDPSDKLGSKSVTEEYEKLNKNIFPDISVGLLHGRLKTEQKEKVMADFVAGRTKILVSTSVVEVGVDVPNASVMMIEGSERFGLAQLHQFRGRVGRAQHQSYCFLFTDSDSALTIERLQALVKSNNGFELAQKDLALRGPGQMFGTAQSGFDQNQIADLYDYKIVKQAQTAAHDLLKQDYTLKHWPALRQKVQALLALAHLE